MQSFSEMSPNPSCVFSVSISSVLFIFFLFRSIFVLKTHVCHYTLSAQFLSNLLCISPIHMLTSTSATAFHLFSFPFCHGCSGMFIPSASLPYDYCVTFLGLLFFCLCLVAPGQLYTQTFPKAHPSMNSSV